uniref:Uncharacterized protein n=1 Tax=Amphimedon queenslandica TaxID=400682 RepID=A0A1X7UJU4_AMPQE
MLMQDCLSHLGELYSQKIGAETPEARLATRKFADRDRGASVTAEEGSKAGCKKTKDRASKDACQERARVQSRKANMTPAERNHHLSAERDRSESKRANETTAKWDYRLAAARNRPQSGRDRPI